jgi:hypothetical protein
MVSPLAISCVFTSGVFLEGSAKFLFTPLELAVVFGPILTAITDRSLPCSTNGCSPAGCGAATARSVLMPLRLHGFANSANYQLPEIGLYYGSSNMASTYGAAGALIIVFVWVYYSAQIFLLGTEFAKAYGDQRRIEG